MSLSVCPSCSRHVRESACPFCGADVAHASPSPIRHLPRIALVGAVAATIASTACSSAYGGPPIDASTPDGSTQDAMATFYGGPPIDAGTE